MLKNDCWIIEQAKKGMITPFEKSCISKCEDKKVISYGLSSYGYDIRLSEKEMLINRPVLGATINVKNFNRACLESVPLEKDKYGSFFTIPANSSALGLSLEKIKMPSNVTGICVGKSSYARVFLFPLVTPLEASWEGYITLEFANHANNPSRIYANEGVLQVLFLEGDPCATTYADRKGKYQNQKEEITLARV